MMRLKERAAALTVAVLFAGLFASPGAASALGGDSSKVRHVAAADESAPEDENPDENAEDQDQSGTQSEAVNDSDEPGEHSDSGDESKDHGDEGGPCTSVSSVSVCIDQPRN